jgi:hypothetical protein
MSAAALGEHVEDLAAKLGVVIIPSWVGSFAEADEFPAGAAGFIEIGDEQGAPIIWVSEDPTSAEPYLVALHELGHHANPPLDLDGTETPSRLQAEELAWAWAEGVSVIPITPRLRKFIERRLNSYRD